MLYQIQICLGHKLSVAVGAFVGTYVFPIIMKNASNPISAGQNPVFVSSALCIFSGFLAFFLPPITQETITQEDVSFRQYLESHGFDTSTMGKTS